MNVLISFILVVGIVITMLIILLLLRSKDRALPQHVLILLFILTLFVSIEYYAVLHQVKWLYFISFIPSDTIAWVFGPFLLLYIKSLFLPEQGLLKKMRLHFIPFSVYLMSISLPTFGYEFFKVPLFSYVDNEYMSILFAIEDCYFISYLIVCLYVLATYKKVIEIKYPTFTIQDFVWIKLLLIGSIAVISIDLVLKMSNVFFGVVVTYKVQYIVVVAMIILILYLGYHGVNQSKVLLPDFLTNEKEIQPIIKNKYCDKVDKKVNNKEFEALKNELEMLFEKDKPYLDEELTLYKLAMQLSITDKKLSTVLNQYMDTTFYDLINTYRVAAIKEMLDSKEYENYTLLGISYECGFKSKTSFNRIFKKETGFSPSEYKKNLSKTD